MLTAGFEPSSELLNSLAKYYYFKDKNTSKTLELISLIRIRNLPLMTTTLNCALASLSQKEKLQMEELQTLLTYAHQKKVRFDTKTYYFTFSCYLKLERIEEAERLIEEMKRKHLNLDLQFFDLLLEYHIKHKNRMYI
jgi:pentatricopeptide repeat protein